ncbi:MAG: tetratricopeptide repeat protein [Bacteroidota bacterium]
MRTLLLRVLLLSLVAAPMAWAQTPEALAAFDTGNARYQAGDYQGALDAYTEVLEAGYGSVALYLNTGNAHYRLDQLAQAIRFYERARQLDPGHEAVVHSLEIAQSRIEEPISQVPAPFWRPTWAALVRQVGAIGLLVGGLLIYGVGLALVGHRVWTGAGGDWHRRARAASLLVGVGLLALSFFASVDPGVRPQAVVQAPTSLLEAAEPSSPALRSVSTGILVEVMGTETLGTEVTWTQVRLPNGQVGWLPATALIDV